MSSHAIHQVDQLCHQIHSMDLQDSSQEYPVEQRLDVVHERLATKANHTQYSAAILIKMLSGEIVPIGVQMDQATETLVDEVVEQLGYNPDVKGRLSFYNREGEGILNERSWKENYGALENIPLFYFLVLEDHDEKWNDRLRLIRKILFDENFRSEVPEEEIHSLYSSWNLFHRSPGKKHNRYTKLAQFIQEHPHVFLPMNPLEIEERDRLHQEIIQRSAEQKEIHTWILLRQEDERVHLHRMVLPAFPADKASLHGTLVHKLAEKPHYTLIGDTESKRNNYRIVRYYFTIQEMLALGLTPERISTDWWIARWYEFSAKAEAISVPFADLLCSNRCSLCDRIH